MVIEDGLTLRVDYSSLGTTTHRPTCVKFDFNDPKFPGLTNVEVIKFIDHSLTYFLHFCSAHIDQILHYTQVQRFTILNNEKTA